MLHSPAGHRASSGARPRIERGGSGRADGGFWLLFERSANAILLLGHEREILDLNLRAEQLIDRSREEIVGTSIVELLAPRDRALSDREWARFLRHGEYTGERAVLRRDGSEVPVEFAAVLSTIGGREAAVYVMTRAPGAIRASARPGAPSGALTKREREVVTLIAMGMETPEIAAEMHVAPATVRAHVRNAMAKLGARTRAQLVALTLCRDDAIHVPALA